MSRDRDGEVEEPAPEHRGYGEREDEGRKRLHDIGEPHGDLVDPAADVADEATDEAAGDDRDCDRGNRDSDIDARREQHPAPQIHAVAVGAQRMGRGGGREERSKVDLFRSPPRDERGQHRAENHDRKKQRTARDQRAGNLRPRPAAMPGRPAGWEDRYGERHVYTLIRGSSAAWTTSATRNAIT